MNPTVKSLIADEHHAIEQYGKAVPKFRKTGDDHLARLMTHIQGEEQEHARELKKAGSCANIGRRAA